MRLTFRVMLVPIHCSVVLSTDVPEVITGGYVFWRDESMREGGNNVGLYGNTAFAHT